ncbi:hydantoinase B/oxoprolinase family protein [Thiohalorhabdus denitrificans]|uniref:N-methylhydantoinase B n=1 Tax=Thiohalorhabdus denitrificans TaxID=381306 RepID=A0A1G5GJ64_9GAMM|nr:hydantoinase B/oxoprolinase family protein [Thiohalorhabdus denitrificans]SCY51575.1 N-methylhydantoinase B [Thiohalorhabdus denitrificans]
MTEIALRTAWNRLIALVNEQAASLQRTAFSNVVREAGDLSAGVFDRQGRMLAQAVTGTPGHINTMAQAVADMLEDVPAETLEAGDVLLTNNPWAVSGHRHDITVVTPVFNGGAPVAYFASTCHAADIGGRGLTTEGRDVFEEGLGLPWVKFHRRGEPDPTIKAIIRENVRVPEVVLGDLRAQVTGGEVATRRLESLDLDVNDLADEILGRSEAAVREAIARIPDGTYSHEVWLDGFEEPLPIRCTVTVAGEEITCDFAGTAPAQARGINVVLNYTAAYAIYAVTCAVAADIPHNAGSFRPIHVTAPEGCLLNAVPPQPVAARHIIGHFATPAVMGALGQAIPLPAEGATGLWGVNIQGTERPWAQTFFLSGGMGAGPEWDGLDATAFPSGVQAVPVEVIEATTPVRILEKSLIEGSGGGGTHTGGRGQRVRLTVDEAAHVSVMAERTRAGAPGAGGGEVGRPGRVVLGGNQLEPKAAFGMSPGEELELALPGGGGFG